MIAWMRKLEITLTSTQLKKSVTFGNNEDDNLNIVVRGNKFMSSLKDQFTVQITNLTYYEIVNLIDGKFYDIEIRCGYKTSGLHTIFKGSVLYISNVLGDRKSNDVYILCASKVVAAYGQARMNLGLNSGINMYNALEFIAKRAGIRNAKISPEFKHRIFTECEEVNATYASFIDTFTQQHNLLINSDSSLNADITVWDPTRMDNRVIVLDPSTIVLTGGYPKLTSDGLELMLMPTFGFCPGDTIVVDNSIIDIGATSKEEALENRGYYISNDITVNETTRLGKYVIYKMEYVLENRGSQFSIHMLCKSKQLISKIAGTIYQK